MESYDLQHSPVITVRPATIFAFVKIAGWLFAATGLLELSWWLWPDMIMLSLAIMVFACYRFFYIRNVTYTITSEAVRVQRGVLFKTSESIELSRMKDYIIARPLAMRWLRLMTLTLKTTDQEHPVICLQGIPYSDLIDELSIRVADSRRRNDIVSRVSVV